MFSSAQKLLEEARIFPRKRCKWPGLLKQEATHRPCVVEDISVGGCRIATNTKGLVQNQRITIEIESRKLRFYGEVRWIRSGEAGVEFLYMD
ncbi:PilZ domain-containing protein [Roseibium sp. FZY0029]|uniref:PilZ domain-containing protein n=1 Tax=Roseibium sp. FZY0029 TaxID=3116647 RepID=UPI002EA76743|nr:PilZ domain-containing protein [Roseibium sp. FZY0029]